MDVQIENIRLNFDKENFPQITSRYSENELSAMLMSMCRKSNKPIKEKNLNSHAINLEVDLEHMFPGG